MSNFPDIENEDLGTDKFSYPFNPSSIRIRRDPFTLGQLVDKIKYNEIHFNTPYQRKGDLWDKQAQSRLIESVLLKLPLPSFYFDEIDSISQTWNVVDGLQRCCAINNFVVSKNLSLTNLEFLGESLEGKTFDDLSRDLQRRIMQTPINIFVIEQGTPDEVKFNIFKRINTGGLILTPQEIRHAMNQGVAVDFVKELSKESCFLKATCNSIKNSRMVDEDFIVRFVSFWLLGYNSYMPDMDSFLSRGMGMIRKCTKNDLSVMKSTFVKSMCTIWQIFGDYSFRKQYERHSKRYPLNKCLFETLGVCIAKLSDDDRKRLLVRSHIFESEFIQLHHNEEFIKAISSSTGTKTNVLNRFMNIERIINKVIRS